MRACLTSRVVWCLAALVLVLGVALTAPAQQAPAPIQIAWSGPLTGDVAELGQGYLNGIKLAFDEWNAKGGVLGGRKFTVVAEDDACDPKQAGTTATKIADDPKNVVFIGHMCSGTTLAGLADHQQGQPAAGDPLLQPEDHPAGLEEPLPADRERQHPGQGRRGLRHAEVQRQEVRAPQRQAGVRPGRDRGREGHDREGRRVGDVLRRRRAQGRRLLGRPDQDHQDREPGRDRLLHELQHVGRAARQAGSRARLQEARRRLRRLLRPRHAQGRRGGG